MPLITTPRSRRGQISVLSTAAEGQGELALDLPQASGLREASAPAPPPPSADTAPLADQLAAFREFGDATRVLRTASTSFAGQPIEVATYVNEYWTAQQRQANALHEVSYRACFKPQLPRFFIERLTRPGERVY